MSLSFRFATNSSKYVFSSNKLLLRQFSRKMPKQFVQLNDISSDHEKPVSTKKHLSKPTLKPVSGVMPKDRLISELYKESTEKGSIKLNMDSLSKEEKKHMQTIMSTLLVRKEDLDEEEVRFFDEFEKMLAGNNKLNTLSPESFIDSLGLTKSDREELELELKDMVNKAEEELKGINLQHLFPDVQNSVSDFYSGLQRCVQEHPEYMTDIQNWLNNVNEKLGKDVHKLEMLSDEDFVRIALPPENVREILKNYLPKNSRISDINLDATDDPRDAFINKFILC